MHAGGCIQKPCSEAEALPIVRTHQDDVCGLDKQGSEILAPALGDATQDGSTTCTVLAWDETKPCAEVSPALECLAGANGSDHCGRDQWANAGHAHEATAVGFFLTDRLNLVGNGLDPFIETYPVFVETNDQAAHPWRYLLLPVLQNCHKRVTQSCCSRPDGNALLDEKGSDLIDRRRPPRDQA